MAFRSFLEFFKFSSNATALESLPKRFLSLFQSHGVELIQIPRLVPEIKLEDLQSEEKLIAVLTPEILDRTARLFGIRIQWLEGIDDVIYEGHHCYKHPEIFLNHLASLQTTPFDPVDIPIRVFTTVMDLDSHNPAQQLLVPVILEKVAELGEDDIYRYHIYRDGFDWGYEPTRIQLKAIIQISREVSITAPLFLISHSEMQALLEGKIFPAKLFRGCLCSEPSLEDYVMSKEASVVAKEIEELPAIRRYIEAHNLQSFRFDAPRNADIPETTYQRSDKASKQVDCPEPSKKAGKRTQAQDDWDHVISAAITLWAEHGPLPTSQVALRIKQMGCFKACAYEVGTIHRRIAKYAPPGNSNPGRKRKKSA